MKVYGLTGGVGMGKSTAGALCLQLGCRVIDTDAVAHELSQPGQPALNEIREAFGGQYFDADGRLRREALGTLVFTDEPARRKLEAILHPRIRHVWQQRLEQWREQGCSRAMVVIPLLFETNAAGEFDKTVCVACSSSLQHRRLLDRGWTTEQITRRIRAQMPIASKIELADYVIWNDVDLDVLARQLSLILEIDPARPTPRA